MAAGYSFVAYLSRDDAVTIRILHFERWRKQDRLPGIDKPFEGAGRYECDYSVRLDVQL